MDTYFKVLLTYQALPRTEKSRSFMDVAGFPSRENVCSNILAFYLNPAAEHGLGDLLLTSLFRMLDLKEDEFPSTAQVRIQREYGTDERKRIELVISHPDFTIGIENKIYHWLANDLEHYAQQFESGRDGRIAPATPPTPPGMRLRTGRFQ